MNKELLRAIEGYEFYLSARAYNAVVNSIRWDDLDGMTFEEFRDGVLSGTAIRKIHQFGPTLADEWRGALNTPPIDMERERAAARLKQQQFIERKRAERIEALRPMVERYNEGATLAELGKEYGVTGSRVYQRLIKARELGMYVRSRSIP